MPLVIGYDEASKNTLKRATQLAYFEFKDDPDLPHAKLNGHEPCTYFSEAHYHENDQFQVVISGRLRMGRHELTPYCVHFSRAYTPYGPLVADADGPGFAFMVMRAHRDSGTHSLARNKDYLARMPGRRPWQVTEKVTFPAPESGAAPDVLLQDVPNIRDDRGLAAYTLTLKPDVKASAPDPSRGDGQYIVVVKGSFWHDNKERESPGLVFVKPGEGPYRIHAGGQGLEAIVLNFPEFKPGSPRAS